MKYDKDINPLLGPKGTPNCSRSQCPSFDGKRCLKTGFIPGNECSPAIWALVAEVERQSHKLSLAEDVIDTMPVCSVCKNVGEWIGSCSYCDDSTYDHDCVERKYTCDIPRCVEHRKALDLFNAVAANE